MKLARAHEYLSTTIAIIVGIALAYFLGGLAGTGRFGLVMTVLGAFAFVALLLGLRQHVWLLIPISMQLNARVEALTGSPAIRDLAIVMVFGGIFALQAFKVIRRKPKYEAIDFWCIFMLLYLLTVFARNPVGGEVLGSDRVGGRPYLNIFVSCLAYWVLSRVTLPSIFAIRAFWFTFGLNLSAGISTIVQTLVPVTDPILGRLFGSVYNEAGTLVDESDGVGRKPWLSGLGGALTLGLISAYSPITVINPAYLGRFLLYALGLVCLLLSGFRSLLITATLFLVFSSYLQHGITKLFRLGLILAVAVPLLTLMQGTVINLPLSVQRTFSFLPGDWDRTALEDAEFSSEWRFFMWRQMLFTDRYIENKWLGDGFGMTRLQLQQSQSAAASNDPAQIQETFMISGSVHSGPIGTIKFVGYCGLVIFLCFMGVLSRRAFLLCQETKGTPYYPFTLYTCIPLVLLPFTFVVIYGSYEHNLPSAIVSAGMLKMLGASLDDYKASLAAAPPLVPILDRAPTGVRPVPAHLQF